MSATSRAILAALSAAHRVSEVRATYHRGTQSVPVRPIKSAAEADVFDAETNTIVCRLTYWLIPADELRFGGRLTPPEERDRIRYQTAHALEIYEVQAVAGQDCYETVDPEGREYRIATRLVERIT